MLVFAVKHKDELTRANSRSGGIFTAISDQFLDGGVVYGCVLDNKFNAHHIRAVSENDRNRMRGSKYIQSQIADCFKQVKNDLDDSKHVLFSGTSCQIAGLRAYLQKDYLNLLCVDIVCHGVPSPTVWRKYLDWVSESQTTLDVDFRNKKKFGWRDHVETITTVQGEKNSKVWTEIFYSGNALRPSCYECPYKSVEHPGDITIADYWGIEKAAPEFDDNKGVSLVLVNTKKGKEWFEKAKDSIVWKETRIEDSMQRAFIKPEEVPVTRQQFWKDFNSKDFTYIAKKYGGLTPLWRRAARKAKRLIKKLLGK